MNKNNERLTIQAQTDSPTASDLGGFVLDVFFLPLRTLRSREHLSEVMTESIVRE